MFRRKLGAARRYRLTVPEGIDEAFTMAIGLSESLTDFLSMQGDSVGIASKTFVAVPALPPNPLPAPST